MCDICAALCKDIEEVYGHRVDPEKLAELIESSPVPVWHTPEPKWDKAPQLTGYYRRRRY